MNKDIKTQWVAALRSGEYTKGVGYLNANDKFCCLGVLCDLAVEAGVTTFTGGGGYGAEREAQTLPAEVQNWAELQTSGGRLPGYFTVNHCHSLWELNDTTGYSFEDIAAVIEEYF